MNQNVNQTEPAPQVNYTEILTEDECLALLAGSTVGRLGVVLDGYPAIFPVNYALDGTLITFRTNPGAKLDAARHGAVSFQVDQLVMAGRAAWSVLLLGEASTPDTEDPATERRLLDLGIRPLDPSAKPHWVQIVPHRITGRRVNAEYLGLELDPRGYL